MIPMRRVIRGFSQEIASDDADSVPINSITHMRCYGAALRRELNESNRRYATENWLSHELSYGHMPSVVYPPDEENRHGNFLSESYHAICADPHWSRRLDKVHTTARTSLPKVDRRWRELDCATSSDALLMNIFCYPELAADRKVLALLGVDEDERAVFGHKPRIPLKTGRFDRTEVDMKLGDLLVEAKLTESDFQKCAFSCMGCYRDFREVFDKDLLPSSSGLLLSCQLLRNVLAAYGEGRSFCVFCDHRRPDLIEAWYDIIRAVRPMELRCRLKLLTWQELATVLPIALRRFLADKYGIGQMR